MLKQATADTWFGSRKQRLLTLSSSQAFASLISYPKSEPGTRHSCPWCCTEAGVLQKGLSAFTLIRVNEKRRQRDLQEGVPIPHPSDHGSGGLCCSTLWENLLFFCSFIKKSKLRLKLKKDMYIYKNLCIWPLRMSVILGHLLPGLSAAGNLSSKLWTEAALPVCDYMVQAIGTGIVSCCWEWQCH